MYKKEYKIGELQIRVIKKPRIGKVVIFENDNVKVESITEIDIINKVISTESNKKFQEENWDKLYDLIIIDNDSKNKKLLNYAQYEHNSKYIGKKVVYYDEQNKKVVRVKKFNIEEQAEIYQELIESKKMIELCKKK